MTVVAEQQDVDSKAFADTVTSTYFYDLGFEVGL